MYEKIDHSTSVRANRSWWDANASSYQAEHADQLGHTEFVWGPEGLTEATAGLLGPVNGRRTLELGAGAAQCSRWLATQGAHPIALDLAINQLRYSQQLDRGHAHPVTTINACAGAIPLADQSIDIAFAAYGALQFVADPSRVFRHVHRVLRPGGRWVFSVTHPIRWAFPDAPGPEGLTATKNYFDTTPYVERDSTGNVRYSEHHRTLAEWLNTLISVGFQLAHVHEPEWTNPNQPTWGGWSKLRGEHIPGTLILSSRKPARPAGQDHS